MRIRDFTLRRSFHCRIIFLSIFAICLLLHFKLMNNLNNGGSERHNRQNIIEFGKSANLERLIRLDIDKQIANLGYEGKAVILTGESKEIGDRRLKEIALNEEVSEHLSYDRTIPDVRNPLCRERHFNLDSLPTASVVIIFYNEPYSVILTTIHSVLNTCDRKILKDVILVDDGSTLVDDKDKLSYYVESRLPRDVVKIERLKDRMGLIRARLAGARLAKGDVLVFLDAHCEGVKGWLEPLLQRISESRSSVVVPLIDGIDAKDFHYDVKPFRLGGFSWDGKFQWINITSRERKRRRESCTYDEEICPTYTPTMAGGLFAIERDYFWEIGSYDDQMDGWGGENLEMSFRIWQCGGTIETIPCSRVGHIFRDFHPYSFPNGLDTHSINTVRLAKVWMDDYIEIFFLNRPTFRNSPDAGGDVTRRRALREKLKCKSFQWYLDNVYPERFIPTKNVQYYGRVAAAGQNLCFDDLQQNEKKPYRLGVYACNLPEVTKSQLFSLTKEGVFRTDQLCATVETSSSLRNNVVMVACSDNDELNEKWEVNNMKQLRHIKTDMCADRAGLQYGDHLYVTKCDPLSATQGWIIGL